MMPNIWIFPYFFIIKTALNYKSLTSLSFQNCSQSPFTPFLLSLTISFITIVLKSLPTLSYLDFDIKIYALFIIFYLGQDPILNFSLYQVCMKSDTSDERIVFLSLNKGHGVWSFSTGVQYSVSNYLSVSIIWK